MAHRNRPSPEHKPAHNHRRRPATAIMRTFLNGGINGEEAYIGLQRYSDTSLKLLAGKLALELAHAETDVVKQANWLNRARLQFEKIGSLITPDELIEDGRIARALIELAQLPNHLAMCATGRLPAVGVTERAFSATVDVARRQRDGALIAWHYEPEGVAARDLSGGLAETSVLLLGQRYATQTLADQSWLPLFAWASEDNHDWRRSTANNAWDVNIFTDVGEGPEETYKVQVKASENGRHDVIDYKESINVVHVNPDLRLSIDEGSVAANIITELCLERSNDPLATTKLDLRTEKLLDLLG